MGIPCGFLLFALNIICITVVHKFSLSYVSVAASDNLEAISEAASSHSVGSDLENENDNLSDMVSANVSGRGTPNISGRDTPTSQAGSQSEVNDTEDRECQEVPNLPVMVKKRNRVDVTDRFGKFDIKSEIESEYFCEDKIYFLSVFIFCNFTFVTRR